MSAPKLTPGERRVVDLGSTVTDEQGEWGVLEVIAGDAQVAEFYFSVGDKKDKARALAEATACAASLVMLAALDEAAVCALRAGWSTGPRFREALEQIQIARAKARGDR